MDVSGQTPKVGKKVVPEGILVSIDDGAPPAEQQPPEGVLFSIEAAPAAAGTGAVSQGTQQGFDSFRGTVDRPMLDARRPDRSLVTSVADGAVRYGKMAASLVSECSHDTFHALATPEGRASLRAWHDRLKADPQGTLTITVRDRRVHTLVAIAVGCAVLYWARYRI